MRALVWFRADLRTVDNRALSAACRAATRGVVAIFLRAPAQWRAHDWGAIRVNFQLRSLDDLSRKLRLLNVPLLIIENKTFADAPETLRIAAREHACDALYFNREYELNERRRDDVVTAAMTAAGMKVHAFDDQVIRAPGTVLTGDGGYYTVFTPFKKRWLAELSADDTQLAPTPRKQPEMVCEPTPIPGSLSDSGAFDRPDLWPAGEGAAVARLKEFSVGQSSPSTVGQASPGQAPLPASRRASVPAATRLERYKDQRDFPAINGTSTLSPYLAVGAISPRQCMASAMECNGGKASEGQPGCDTWISELIWREFYKHILVGFPRVNMHRAFRAETEDLPWNDDDEQFDAWCEGRTGFPIVDAAMRQLRQTGWMHNRLRMIVAMFLTKDLFIDWRRGERFFMQHLVDGDLAANNGGWQWSASTGTDAAPYFRIFNPISQSRRFDPQGAFIRKLLPELAPLDDAAIHDPYDSERGGAVPFPKPLDYPRPIIDRNATRARVLAAFATLRP